MANKKYSLKLVGIRMVREKTLYSPEPILSPAYAVDVIRDFIRDFDREAMGIIAVSAQGDVLNASLVSVGSLDCSVVSPREIFKTAILSNAARIIMFHNHPSGNPMPSPEDREVTARIRQAGELMGIKLDDHIIYGDGLYYSFMEHNEPSLINGKDEEK